MKEIKKKCNRRLKELYICKNTNEKLVFFFAKLIKNNLQNIYKRAIIITVKDEMTT